MQMCILGIVYASVNCSIISIYRNRMHVLLSERTEYHLPICEINPRRNLHSTLHKFMVVRFQVFSFLDFFILRILFLLYKHLKIFAF